MMGRSVLLSRENRKLTEELFPQDNYHENLQPLVDIELNLELLPVAVVGSGSKGRGRQVVLDEKTVDENGEGKHLYWEVTPSSEYGALTSFDLDVYTAATEILFERGTGDEGEVDFSLYELAQRMGLAPSGKVIGDIKSSLLRWLTTTMHSRNAFWIKDEQRALSESFQLIYQVSFAEASESGKKRSRGKLYFNRFYMRSVLARYIGKVDPGMYWAIEGKLARRLYKLIEASRRGESAVDLPLGWVRRHTPISCESYPSKIKRALEAANTELLEKHYLKKVSYPTNAMVRYEISADYLYRYQILSSGISTRKEAFLVHRLSGVKGLSRKEAIKLVLEYGPESCAYYLDSLEYLRQSQNIPKPAGWLKGALRDGYDLSDHQLPPSYRSGDQGESQGSLVDEPYSGTDDQDQQRRWEGYEGLFDREEGPAEASTPQSGEGDDSSESAPASSPEPDPEAQRVWEQVLEGVRETINAPSLNTWFKDVVAVEIKGDILTLSVPNSFAREYIESRFLRDLQSSLSAVLGREGSITVVERSVEEG